MIAYSYISLMAGSLFEKPYGTIPAKGILFDYGGTIDSNGMHWAEVIWMAYEALKVPVSKAVFRDAYVHGRKNAWKESDREASSYVSGYVALEKRFTNPMAERELCPVHAVTVYRSAVIKEDSFYFV